MKTILIILMFMTTSAVGADQISMFFRYGTGSRIDYSPSKPEGKTSDDAFPDSAVMHVLIPQSSTAAQVSVTYGKDGKGREDQSYRGIVVHRTGDMIAIVCKFDGTDKVENIVIYPKKSSAFLIIYSAYFGNELLKAIAAENAEIPFGSVSVFRLKQLQK